MIASDLEKMLATRHSGDVLVFECKDGPTQTRAHRRLDAWVLLKRWSPITTIGYEIKVDRNDWRRDEKVQDYMPLCHLLYIVAPKGVVPVDELPTSVGLMEPVGTAGRLQIKRKASRREIALPGELMVYVLMCRTKITRDSSDYVDREWRVRELRRWAEEKEDRGALSYALSQKIRRKFDQLYDEVEAQRRRNDSLEQIKGRIIELGFDPATSVNHWSVLDRLNRFNLSVDANTLGDMRSMSKTLTKMADALERLKSGQPDSETTV